MIDLPEALEISCDTFFYQLGNEFYDRYLHRRSDQFPVLLRRFGFGATLPLDIRAAHSRRARARPAVARARRTPNPIDQDWQPGYDITMAIGQSDLQVTPLQLATAYSALANGGTLATPHVAQSSTDVTTGRTTEIPLQAAAQARTSRRSSWPRSATGLYKATHASDGTSTSVFGTFQPAVAGKTGTAEKARPGPIRLVGRRGRRYDDPKIVVVALIESGGHGGVSAAPAAREVYSRRTSIPNTQTTVVKGTDRSH